LDLEEAQAMLWAADFSTNGTGDPLDVRQIACILGITHADSGGLPPQPKMMSRDARGDADVAASQVGTQNWARGAVVDIRRSDYVSWVPAKLLTLREKVDEAESIAEEAVEEASERITLSTRAKIHLLLDDPNSSRAANMTSVVMGIMIIVSVVTLFTEPLSKSAQGSVTTKTEKAVWFGFECFFTVLFTIEFVLQLGTCTSLGRWTYIRWIKDPMHICDLVAIMPFYIDLAFDTEEEAFRLFRIARLMRLSRLVRLGRLAKRSATFAPIAMILVVIWGIYMKNGLKSYK